MKNYYDENGNIKKILSENTRNPLDLSPDLSYNKSEDKSVGDNAQSFSPAGNNSPGSLIGKGFDVKKSLQELLSKVHPEPKYKNLFGDIDEATIEKNLPLADSVVEKNSAASSVNRSIFKKLPYLKYGLAMFYAASETGNYKAAKEARKLAYTEVKNEETSAKPATGNKRYVNDTSGLNIRSAAGTGNSVIGKLKFGDEVEFTGNKTDKINGYEWAEIKYGDKTGWVAADYLNTEMPYDMVAPNRTDSPESKTPQQQNPNVGTNNTGAGTRYIGEKEISLRDAPGFGGKTVGSANYGESVAYTGNKKKVDGVDWAEIKYGDKTGWILANCLKTAVYDSVIDKNVPKGMIVNQEMGTEERTAYLNKMVPEWMAESGTVTKPNMIEWYKSKGANVKYTGTYCLPIKNIDRISQGFYGTYSHAGKHGYEEGSKCGAVDISAIWNSPVYSVLQGKVVYTAKPNTDYHRVTVETQINGETYYIEYLHCAKINVEVGQQLSMGTQIGTVGSFGKDLTDDTNGVHLDFRIYQFKEGAQKSFNVEGNKQFFDPFEFFDFDVQYGYNLGRDDYN